MARIITFRDLLGLIKDKASLSKAAILSKPNALSIRLAVLRATKHYPIAPPADHRLAALLSLGETSRSSASPVIVALMDRLHRTGNCVVALKCLIIIHHVVRSGPYVLRDQLTVFPAAGGYNYLKMSDFREGATAATWALSSWVRWHARYLETILSTSRIFGYFICSSSCSMDKEKQERKISSFSDVDLIGELDSLVVLIEEICKAPDTQAIQGNKLVQEIVGLLCNDYVSLVNQVVPRLAEFKERLSRLSFSDSVALVSALKRLKDCKERLSVLYVVEKPSIRTMWGSVQELKDGVGLFKERGRLLRWRTRDEASEPDQFERRVLASDDSVHFELGNLSINRIPSFLIVDKSV